MKTWITLVRREYWENRALWIAPLIAAGFVIAGSLFAAFRTDADFARGPRFPETMPDFGGSDRALAVSIFVFASLILVIGLLATASYLIDSLYSERRDRSILFWKSLPVSDAQTVGSKALVALVISPLVLLAMIVATHLVCYLIAQISPSPLLGWMRAWSPSGMLRSYSWVAALIFVNSLWFAPVAAYAMLASVLSRKSPWLLALVPLVLICVGEQLLLSSSYSWRWVAARLMPRIRVEGVLGSLELWLGLVAAAGAFLLIVRLRRWRDDS